MLGLAGLLTLAGQAAAEPAPWAPLRFGISGVLGIPLDGELPLTSVEFHVLQQAGRVAVDGQGHGSGLIAGIGGTAGLGTFAGPRLDSGFVRQDRMVFVRAAPHLALVKSPERGFAEVGPATALGFSFRPIQLEAAWRPRTRLSDRRPAGGSTSSATRSSR